MKKLIFLLMLVFLFSGCIYENCPGVYLKVGDFSDIEVKNGILIIRGFIENEDEIDLYKLEGIEIDLELEFSDDNNEYADFEDVEVVLGEQDKIELTDKNWNSKDELKLKDITLDKGEKKYIVIKKSVDSSLNG